MADGLGSDDVEMEDMDRAGSGRRGSTSFDGVPAHSVRASSAIHSEGSPLTSPMGSLTGGDDRPGGGTFVSEAPSTEHGTADGTVEARIDQERLMPLSGINDDGYFGDASGTWLRLEPRARITFETRGAEDKSFAREVRDFCNAYGGAFFGSLLAVVVLTTVLIVWASHLEQRSNPGGGG